MAVVNAKMHIRAAWGENRPVSEQFDPALAVYYRAARPKLEAYYSSLSAEGAQ